MPPSLGGPYIHFTPSPASLAAPRLLGQDHQDFLPQTLGRLGGPGWGVHCMLGLGSRLLPALCASQE